MLTRVGGIRQRGGMDDVTGAVIWPSSTAMAGVMEHSSRVRGKMQDATVLELGAGLGLVGMAASSRRI